MLTVLIEPFAELLCCPEVGAAEALDDVFKAWKRVIDVGALCKTGPSAAKPASKLLGFADAIDDLQASVFRLVKKAVIFDYHKWRDVFLWISELMQYSRLDLAVQEMMTGAPASSSAPASGKAGESSGTTQPEMQPRDGLEPAVQKAIWCEVDGLLQKCSQGRATYQAGMLTEARLEATESGSGRRRPHDARAAARGLRPGPRGAARRAGAARAEVFLGERRVPAVAVRGVRARPPGDPRQEER